MPHSPTLEFKFNFKLPEPRKRRIIAKGDEYGRIVRSIPPEIYFEATSNPMFGGDLARKAKSIRL
jgi:hypothetical protein